jgi:predicted O-methyltransferase YrrM
MELKYTPLTDSLYNYLCAQRSNAADPVLHDLRTKTERLGDDAVMMISEEQGSFFSLLVAAIGAKTAVEIGTFTGYSSICIARGLAPGGRLFCFDVSEEWTAIAREYWVRAGVDDRIELRLGDAKKTLRQLDPALQIDFAFIDADKTGYDAYYEMVLPRVRQNGLIVFDNMLWGGRLGAGPVSDPGGAAIDALNRKLASDPRVESVLLPIADGLNLCRKL